MDFCLSSVVCHTEQGGTSTHPVVLGDFTWELEEQHEVCGVACGTQLTSPEGGLIERAGVSLFLRGIRDNDGFEPDDGHLDNGVLGVTIINHLLLEVPFRALEEETVDLNTVLGGLIYSILEMIKDVSLEG